MKQGLFFVLEGIDGSGKTTQGKLLAKRLEEHFQESVCQTQQPSGGPIGTLIRQMLTGRIEADNQVVAQLFAADRLDHLTNPVDGLISFREKGKNIVCDRYYFSSYAYHGVDLPMEEVISMNRRASQLFKPTANIFIDVKPEQAMIRLQKGRHHQELFENRERLEKVYDNYQKAFQIFEKEEKFLIIQGDGTEKEVAERIWEAVSKEFL